MPSLIDDEASELAARLDRIKKLTDALAEAQADAERQKEIVAGIRRELAAARRAVAQIESRSGR